MVVKSAKEIGTPKEIQDGGGIYKKGVCEPGTRKQCIDEERADRYIPPAANSFRKPITVATTGDNSCFSGESSCHVQDVPKSTPRWLDKGMTTAATFVVKVLAALNLGGCRDGRSRVASKDSGTQDADNNAPQDFCEPYSGYLPSPKTSVTLLSKDIGYIL